MSLIAQNQSLRKKKTKIIGLYCKCCKTNVHCYFTYMYYQRSLQIINNIRRLLYLIYCLGGKSRVAEGHGLSRGVWGHTPQKFFKMNTR